MKKLLFLFILCFSGPVVMAQETDFSLAGDNENKLIALKYLDMAWTQGKIQEARAMYYAKNFVNHPPERSMRPPESEEGNGNGEATEQPSRPPFNIKYDFKQVFSDGEYVIVHSLVKDGPGVGEPINGMFLQGQTKIGDEVIDIFRIRDGKILEKWDTVEPISSMEVF